MQIKLFCGELLSQKENENIKSLFSEKFVKHPWRFGKFNFHWNFPLDLSSFILVYQKENEKKRKKLHIL